MREILALAALASSDGGADPLDAAIRIASMLRRHRRGNW